MLIVQILYVTGRLTIINFMLLTLVMLEDSGMIDTVVVELNTVGKCTIEILLKYLQAHICHILMDEKFIVWWYIIGQFPGLCLNLVQKSDTKCCVWY